jgi:hypothetical protein
VLPLDNRSLQRLTLSCMDPSTAPSTRHAKPHKELRRISFMFLITHNYRNNTQQHGHTIMPVRSSWDAFSFDLETQDASWVLLFWLSWSTDISTKQRRSSCPTKTKLDSKNTWQEVCCCQGKGQVVSVQTHSWFSGFQHGFFLPSHISHGSRHGVFHGPGTLAIMADVVELNNIDNSSKPLARWFTNTCTCTNEELEGLDTSVPHLWATTDGITGNFDNWVQVFEAQTIAILFQFQTTERRAVHLKI